MTPYVHNTGMYVCVRVLCALLVAAPQAPACVCMCVFMYMCVCVVCLAGGSTTSTRPHFSPHQNLPLVDHKPHLPKQSAHMHIYTYTYMCGICARVYV